MIESKRLFVLGGTGFVGMEMVREAVARGHEVSVLVRPASAASRVRTLGAAAVSGDAAAPREWIDAVRGAHLLVDLVQPKLPERIGPKEIDAVAIARLAMTRELLSCLAALPAEERPLLVSVSGTDDLEPDADGRIDERSSLTRAPRGFARIGVPVRRAIEASGMAAAFVYLGTVYGPGKSFAASVFPRLARGRMLLPRRPANRMPLVHVEDAARAIVHLAGLRREALLGRSWLIVDREGGTPLGAFFDQAAALLGARPPLRAPHWLLSRLIGTVLFETLRRDLHADSSALVASGFALVYPTYRQGLPVTLDALGYTRPAVPAARSHRLWLPLMTLTLLAAAAANLLPFPLSVPALRDLAHGQTILDMRLGYGPSDVARLFDALGEVGRARYVELLWTVDLALPALFAASLWTAIGAGALRRWRWVALAAAAADYLENVSVTLLLQSYPVGHAGLVRVAAALTASKLALYVVAAVLAMLGRREKYHRRHGAEVA